MPNVVLAFNSNTKTPLLNIYYDSGENKYIVYSAEGGDYITESADGYPIEHLD